MFDGDILEGIPRGCTLNCAVYDQTVELKSRVRVEEKINAAVLMNWNIPRRRYASVGSSDRRNRDKVSIKEKVCPGSFIPLRILLRY